MHAAGVTSTLSLLGADPDHQRATFDAADRILTRAYPADSSLNVTFTYDETGHGDGVGRLTSVTDAAGSLSRSYDARGSITNEIRVSGGAQYHHHRGGGDKCDNPA